MKKTVDKFLKWIHFQMPLWVSGFYMPLVYLFRHLNSLWVREFLVEGKLQGGESVLRLGYFGNDKRIFCYWVNNLFSETYRIEEKQKVPLWKISSSLDGTSGSYELALTEVTRISRRIGMNGTGYILPRWVDTLLQVENSLDAVNNKKVRKNISKHCFTFRESRSEEDLRFFYERMFKPYILGRHKDASVMVDFSYFRKRMRKKRSKLFFLMQGDEPMAASFNEMKSGRMKFSGLGVLDGCKDIIQMGAIRALYYFMLNQYRDQGTEVINYGGTSPLLSDGLTKFKRSMRAIPTDRNPYGEKSLWLIPVKPSEGLNSFLHLHPFLYLDKGRFYRALFPNAEVVADKKEFLTWLKQTQFLGIEGTRIYCRDHVETIRQWILEASLEGYEVLNCDYLIKPEGETDWATSQKSLTVDPVQH